jgi:RNA polymerase sigma factor (sigma-70 family)
MQPPNSPHWPREISRLASDLRDRPELRGRLWLLIHSALEVYLRLHASRRGKVDAEDIHDLAAQKSLELIQKLDSHKWSPQDDSTGEVKAFLSTVARNSLVDLLRQSARSERLPAEEDGDPTAPAWDRERAMPDDDVQRQQFTAALRRCAARLKPAWRTIWFFRVFYDMPSKVIARHPEVHRKPSYVDVTLQRCREQMRECMRRSGFEVFDLPPGSYAALWDACRGAIANPSPGTDHE